MCVCVEALSCRHSTVMTRDVLLIRLMYYVLTGKNVVIGDRGGQLTPLEKALEALRSLEPLCIDSIARLADSVTSLISQQVQPAELSVCCGSVHFLEFP